MDNKTCTTVLYLKWITKKDLLWSTENSVQCRVAARMGKEFGREWIHVYVCLGPLCCAPETLRLLISWLYCSILQGFPGSSDGKESACNAGDPGSIPGLRRSPGGGHGHPLQYFCQENSMDRGAWQATVHGVTKSQT